MLQSTYMLAARSTLILRKKTCTEVAHI